MRHTFYLILGFAFSFLLGTQAQNTGNIYTTPQDSENGGFVFPRKWPMTFREGSTINITWSTDFISVNLYYYQRGNVANSIQLASKS
jgi:hypothetical protein